MATTNLTGDNHDIDWIERKTSELVRAAKRTGCFADCIDEAHQLRDEHGYAWVVALAKSLEYWAR